MTLFPDQPSDALSAALEMQTSVKSFNEVRVLSGKQAIQIGIGIHTGPLMLGTIGEEGRYEGTVIADAVNLAARIESLTKDYGTPILISEACVQNLNTKHEFALREIERVQVKGKSDFGADL